MMILSEWHNGCSTIAIDRHRQDCEPRVSSRRQAIERRHLADAGAAPGSPKVEQHHSAAELPETGFGPIEYMDRNVGSGTDWLKERELAAAAAKHGRVGGARSRTVCHHYDEQKG